MTTIKARRKPGRLAKGAHRKPSKGNRPWRPDRVAIMVYMDTMTKTELRALAVLDGTSVATQMRSAIEMYIGVRAQYHEQSTDTAV